MKARRPKRSDIDTREILQACQRFKDRLADTPDVVLKGRYPVKVIMAKLARLREQGYLDYGVSLRTAWLTDKGRQYLADTTEAPP